MLTLEDARHPCVSPRGSLGNAQGTRHALIEPGEPFDFNSFGVWWQAQFEAMLATEGQVKDGVLVVPLDRCLPDGRVLGLSYIPGDPAEAAAERPSSTRSLEAMADGPLRPLPHHGVAEPEPEPAVPWRPSMLRPVDAALTREAIAEGGYTPEQLAAWLPLVGRPVNRRPSKALLLQLQRLGVWVFPDPALPMAPEPEPAVSRPSEAQLQLTGSCASPDPVLPMALAAPVIHQHWHIKIPPACLHLQVFDFCHSTCYSHMQCKCISGGHAQAML